jgi:hypothetical protein
VATSSRLLVESCGAFSLIQIKNEKLIVLRGAEYLARDLLLLFKLEDRFLVLSLQVQLQKVYLLGSVLVNRQQVSDLIINF